MLNLNLNLHPRTKQSENMNPSLKTIQNVDLLTFDVPFITQLQL